ncbi:ABC transporter permease [Demequina mangrovi]|uniref:Autoinducer 2 import system permease protein LsrD n=1 Tax=Demequina mangrovi TaxID=1043493 RepID=A0A1H6UL39_9MICO|nr:ABC transporter permease [Demequina mangrovi]SEI93031.1 rhamnose transport system permease protein [Demequina mangrovi]
MASTTLTPTTSRTYRDFQRPRWQRMLLTREMAVVAALIGVIAFASVAVDNFASSITYTYLFLDVAAILLIALPMTLVIVTGEIDLSVASVVGLSSVLTGTLYQAGLPFAVAALLAIAAGAVAGAINGFLVTVVGLPSLAVTIGTLALFRGLAVGLLGTTAITDFPDSWRDLVTNKIPGTPVPAIIVLVVVLAIVFGWLLHFTPFGRGIFAIGQSKEAAHFSGVRVGRTKLILFILSGTVAALAGIYYTLRYGSARGDNATGLELSVVAAVLLGGVSIFGGRGALHGPIAGALLIGAMASALRLASVTSDVINVITGTLLILSVVSPSLLAWAQSRRARRRGKKEGEDPASADPRPAQAADATVARRSTMGEEEQ